MRTRNEDSERQIKILTLQKENESLKHKLEVVKMKLESDLKEARSIQNPGAEKESKKLLTRDVACQTEERNLENQNLSEVLGEEPEEVQSNEVSCQNEEKGKENQNLAQLLNTETKIDHMVNKAREENKERNEKENQKLIRWENQNLTNECSNVDRMEETDLSEFDPIFKKLCDGAKRLWSGDLDANLYSSYEVWYSENSSQMEN